MKEYVITTEKDSIKEQKIVGCIGYFDGFHIGHQTLFNKTLAIAKQKNLKSALITFDPDPWVILKGLHNIQHVTTLNDRRKLAEVKGFDIWITLQFDVSMAKLNPNAFLDLLHRNNIDHLVCGYDFKFGDKGAGDINTLKNQTVISSSIMEEFDYLDEKVSTTRIIDAIKAGDMILVKKLMGRPYKVTGIVVHGKRIGTQIGFPTANLKVDQEYVIPRVGVYAGYAAVDGIKYPAMIAVGYNPTVKDDDLISIEAHLFDYANNLYGKEMEYYFIDYLRSEMKFADLQGLITQLKIDDMNARKIVKKL
ncbi:MAG: riboflavin kinase/FMN adenylyltransferase [Erysipelotrichaceae bacterium]|nr:MAG: riboflavin kinase/FMN [Erysipelotrichaceae bacterium]TXT16518.1 MAG: riboflavin kinase/FMN adenylyltransferase [Erysipelotrichaceae bacterium]